MEQLSGFRRLHQAAGMEEVGADQFFLFGLTAEAIFNLRAKGYNPGEYYKSSSCLREAIDLIHSGYFSNKDTKLFEPLIQSLIYRDEYMVFADYQSYIDCQDKVSQAYRNQEEWSKMSILTVSRMGKFSSDRSIREYCDHIWKVQPVHIELKEE